MKTVQDYFNYIAGIVDKCEVVVNRVALCRGKGKVLGSVMAPGRQKDFLACLMDCFSEIELCSTSKNTLKLVKAPMNLSNTVITINVLMDISFAMTK